MSRNPKLNDLQLILLATAVQRDDGSILPPSATLGDQGDRIRQAIPSLLKRALVVEVPVTEQTQAWRAEDQQAIGLVITDAGRAIIAAEEQTSDAGGETMPVSEANVADRSPEVAGALSSPRAGSKIETVINLLQREEGSTLATMVEATGWLPHTTRAALTGLRKKGHAIAKSTRDGATVYHIAAVA